MPQRDPKAERALTPWAEGLDGARAAQVRSLTALHDWWREAAGRVPGEQLARWAVDALEGMGDGDSISWGMLACDVLRRHGGPDEAARLRAVRSRLPARRALRDWRLEVGRALSVIGARAAGGCTCAAEASHGAPAFAPQFTVASEETDHAHYAVIMQVYCRCGRRWRVVRQEGYHYPVFRWAALDGL